jgi:Mg-chelatase subunit ChlD
MAIHLDEYASHLDALAPRSRELLDAAWPGAARVLSPRGLDNYVKAAAALRALGRGDALVECWIEQAPQVAAELGEDVLGELAAAALALASKTSGAVIELLLATAPTAAARLGDAALFAGYLQFIGVLVAQAPRGVRPMLERLDVLLRQLTLGGLRRWASWGAHAYRTDYAEQLRYFALESREAQAMLAQERKGTLLVDVQRRINMYLRALWGRDFFMRPTSGDYERRDGYRPFIEDGLLHLPDAYDDHFGVAGVELYRAAAAHAAAHIVETREPISAEGLSPLQMALIGLVEDARVEALAIRRFPGLQPLWARLHDASPARDARVADWFDRIARALLDAAYVDADPLIVEARALFAAAQSRLHDPRLAWDIGVTLAHRLGARGASYNPRRDLPSAPYRDDNRYFWTFDGFEAERDAAAGRGAARQLRKYVNVMEMANEVEVENAGDDAQEVWVLGTELFPYEDAGVSVNESWGREPVSEPFHYAEWDYQIQLERPAWTTVLERRGRRGALESIDAISAQYKREIQRMKFLLDAMQPQGVQRIRKLEDGDEVDLNAAVDAMVDVRTRRQPDPRIMLRSLRRQRDFAILVLLDLSQSTNERVAGHEHSVLDLTRQACVLLADAVAKVGDPFAIHGFCSDGRHDVQYLRFKDFEQPWGDEARQRLAGMSGQLSTRMGAAIRHAGHHLQRQRAARKLLIVITDGEPADVDVRDPQYLRADAKKAVEAVARDGVASYCISVDPRADPYVARIFGQNRYLVIDHVQRLPERLPLLYAALTR